MSVQYYIGFKKQTIMKELMRSSLWIGAIVLAIGIGFWYLLSGLAGVSTVTSEQYAAVTFATVLFLLASASFTGSGIALLLHWLAGFTNHWTALFIDLTASCLIVLAGIVGAILSQTWIAGLHSVLTGFTAGAFLISLSTLHLFGGLFERLNYLRQTVVKKLWRKKKRR